MASRNFIFTWFGFAGLEELNRYLVHIRLHSSPSVSSAPTFDDEDDTSLFADASESVDVVDSKPHDFLFSALTEKYFFGLFVVNNFVVRVECGVLVIRWLFVVEC